MKIAMTKDELVALVRNNLRRLRIDAGLSQSELARRSGTSSGWINDIEHGRRHGMTVGALAPVCEALGVHPGLLFLPEEMMAGLAHTLVTDKYRQARAAAKREAAA
jgi:transcriptional regulator with XRE-family HTH domain